MSPSTWVWTSMKPGATTRLPASMTREALSGAMGLEAGEAVMAQRIELESKDGKYTWELRGAKLSGTVTGTSINFDCVDDGKPCGALKGQITDSGMSGDGTIDGVAMKWTARR